ncbi:uncharacterized protein [Macrobrachium rosenbergii]|uniref:uncharacterized protein n=1 Tax=Macrobrachium rosenbergii TaxID=79674 RepID=UPI0034D69A1D
MATTPVFWVSVTAPLLLLLLLLLSLSRNSWSLASVVVAHHRHQQDARTHDILHSRAIIMGPHDFIRSKRWPETLNSVPEEEEEEEEEATDGSGSTFEESRFKDLNSKVVGLRRPKRNNEVGLRRPKRKVISRGSHYMIRSSSGSSPWSSTSYDAYSTYRTSRPRGYGWNPRGRIGDSGLRTTTFGEIIPKKPERRSQRKKIARTFKGEIAQYAMLHGPKKAAMHYEKRVGRRLKERIILKFVQRYKDRVEKNKKKARS